MDKRKEGVLEIVIAAAIVITAFAAAIWLSGQEQLLSQYGYIGIFIVALITSATIVIPAPALWPLVVAIQLNPFGIGIVAGLGSGIGELTGYLAGDGTRDILNDRIKESKKITEFVKKYDVLAIFALSVIPNPLFDIAGIAAGALGMKWWRFLLSCIVGKVVKFVIAAYVGQTIIGFLW